MDLRNSDDFVSKSDKMRCRPGFLSAYLICKDKMQYQLENPGMREKQRLRGKINLRFDGRQDELEGRRGVKTNQRDEISSMAPFPEPQRAYLRRRV